MPQIHDTGSIGSLSSYITGQKYGIKGFKVGGVLYLVDCQEVNVTVVQHTYCCQQLPVSYNGVIMYADPLTYTLGMKNK